MIDDFSGAVRLGAVNVESDDPPALARFWAAALGGNVETSTPELAYVSARTPDGFAMFFQRRRDSRRGPQTQHLDLTVPWQSRSDEVARFTALGATRQWDVLDEVPWARWTTMSDPEGNLFCIAEHPPTTPQTELLRPFGTRRATEHVVAAVVSTADVLK